MRSWASCGILPTPQNLMLKTCKSQSKANQTKKVFAYHTSFLQVTGDDPIPHGTSHELEQQFLVILSLDYMCMV
jgi:hypothetical protein